MENQIPLSTVSVQWVAGAVPGGGVGAGVMGSGPTGPTMPGGGMEGFKLDPKPICMECGRMYSSVSNLKQHMANVHSNSNNWEPCPICGKHFKTRQYLFNHLLQTHGIRQRSNRMPMPCPPPLNVTISPVSPAHGPLMPPHAAPLPPMHPPVSVSLNMHHRPTEQATTIDQCLEMLSSKDGSRSLQNWAFDQKLNEPKMIFFKRISFLKYFENLYWSNQKFYFLWSFQKYRRT